MKGRWIIKKLGDVCEKITDGSHNPPKGVASSDFMMLSSKNIFDDLIHFEDPRYLTQKDFDSENKRTEVRHNDVLLTIVGTIGRVAVVPINHPKFTLQRSVAVLKIKKDFLDSRFLMFSLQNILKFLTDEARGVAQKGIYLNQLREIEIPLPPLPEQQRIVSILDEAFAAIAKAKANAEQNLKNAKELFESYLQGVFENGDWEEKRFEELCDLITCGVAATPKYVDESEGVPFLSAQNVRDGQVVLDKYRFISKQFHQELTKKNKPQKGDILYSRVGSKFGEAGVVEHDFEFSVYVSLTLIKPKPDKLNNHYLKYYLNSPIIKAFAKKSISSSGVPNLNVKEVREFPIKCPSISIQKKIINEIETLSAETKKLEAIYQQKINDLEELKKSVLQKAFSGELKTEKAVEI
jgi:type I restriction enzyme S subunit